MEGAHPVTGLCDFGMPSHPISREDMHFVSPVEVQRYARAYAEMSVNQLWDDMSGDLKIMLDAFGVTGGKAALVAMQMRRALGDVTAWATCTRHLEMWEHYKQKYPAEK